MFVAIIRIEIHMEKQPKLLLVEDDPTARMLSIFLLKNECNCLVDVVETGQTALDAVKNNVYDLILLDLGLPDMDGQSVAANIRKINPSIPIVIVTAHGAKPEHSKKLLEIGINAYMIKPLSKEKAQKILKQLNVI